MSGLLQRLPDWMFEGRNPVGASEAELESLLPSINEGPLSRYRPQPAVSAAPRPPPAARHPAAPRVPRERVDRVLTVEEMAERDALNKARFELGRRKGLEAAARMQRARAAALVERPPQPAPRLTASARELQQARIRAGPPGDNGLGLGPRAKPVAPAEAEGLGAEDLVAVRAQRRLAAQEAERAYLLARPKPPDAAVPEFSWETGLKNDAKIPRLALAGDAERAAELATERAAERVATRTVARGAGRAAARAAVTEGEMGLGLGLGELFGLGMLGYSAARMAGMKRQAEPLEFLFNPFGLGSNDIAQPPTKYTRDDVDYRNPGRMW